METEGKQKGEGREATVSEDIEREREEGTKEEEVERKSSRVMHAGRMPAM